MPCPIYQHDAHAEILPCLAAHLPQSISLLRRIQHGVSHPTPTARVLATFPPGARPPDDAPWLAARVDLFRGRETQMIIYSSLERSHTSIKPIKIALSNQNQNQHTGTGIGADTRPKDNDNNPPSPYIVSTFDAPASVLETVRDQLVSLLTYIKIHLLPSYLASLQDSSANSSAQEISHNSAADSSVDTGASATSATSNSPINGSKNGTETKKPVKIFPAPSPHAFLLGSLHTALFSTLQRTGSEVFTASKSIDGSTATPVSGLRVHRFDDPPYYKFFFRRAALTSTTDLPVGYRFHDRQGRFGVLDSHFDLVQSRTQIPRPRDQLRKITGSAIYVDEDGEGEELPIAWAFLGVDGALATLHVEEEHRGKGLALPLSKEAMSRGLARDGVFGAGKVDIPGELVNEVEGWVHTEVAQYNVASQRVMEKIGGEILSTVIWTVIEVCD